MRSLFLKIFLWFWLAQLCIGAALYLLALANQRGFDRRLFNMVGDNLDSRGRAAAVAYEVGGDKAVQEAWLQSTPHHRDGPGGGFGGGFGDGGPPPPFGGDDGHGPSFGDGGPGRQFPPPPPRDEPHGPEERGMDSFYVLRGTANALVPTLLAGPMQPPIFTVISTTTFNNGEVVRRGRGGSMWLARRIDSARGNHYMALTQISARGIPGGFWGNILQLGGPNPAGPWRFVVIVLTMGLVCYTLARHLTDPILKLRQATNELAAGNLAARVGPHLTGRRDELADLGRDFDLMAERIESLRTAERRLLGDISHELRSPLARLQVTLDLAEDSANAEMREYLGHIGEEADELNSMIDQLLTLTRLENASPDMLMSDKVDLGELVQRVCSDCAFEAKARGGEVTLTENAACEIKGNGQLLRSAIENVVRNALLHAGKTPRVEAALQVAGKQIKITIRDFGPGVPAEALDKLFNPFYRVAEARDRQSGGVGLGLSITERAMKVHGGEVAAENAPGGGLLITMILPVND